MAHIPVLLQEVIRELNLRPGMVVVDGTLGGGGHAREIIKAIMPNGVFVGIDWDQEFLQQTAEQLQKEFSAYRDQLHFVHGNYADTKTILQGLNIRGADAMVADVGFSSWHVDEAHRGFSFHDSDVLDMRYDISQGTPAYAVVNSFTEQRIADILFRYGQERYSRRIAKAIVQERKQERILTADRLQAIVEGAVGKAYARQKIDPATRTFQALRIYVNEELDNLEHLLETIPRCMNPKGRVAIIAFHSMEDRLVKHHFKHLQEHGRVTVITKKPIVPQDAEVTANPRSRSAKLRVIEINS